VEEDTDHAYACMCSRGRVPKKLSIVMPDDAIECTACDADEDDQVDATITEVDDSDGFEVAEDADGVDSPWLEWLNNGGLPRCTLPFHVLRVLELTGYDLEPYSDGRRQLAFPRLEAMRLRQCHTELATLQNMISAAPKLADVRLVSLTFVDEHYVYRLRCEAATVFVMEDCGVLIDNLRRVGCSVRLDTPRLLHFRYADVTAFKEDTSFSFEYPRPPRLEHADVEVHSATSVAASLWRSILFNVREVRSLKITAYSIADLDIDLEPCLCYLERLEIEELIPEPRRRC
jgi:hypothetical protein